MAIDRDAASRGPIGRLEPCDSAPVPNKTRPRLKQNRLAEELATRLVPDDRLVNIEQPTDRGMDYRNWSDHDVYDIISNIGGNPQIADEIRAEIAEKGSSPREHLLYLTSVDPKLRSIVEKPESERTPAEKELLERGLHLGKRLYEAAPKYYEKIFTRET